MGFIIYLLEKIIMYVCTLVERVLIFYVNISLYQLCVVTNRCLQLVLCFNIQVRWITISKRTWSLANLMSTILLMADFLIALLILVIWLIIYHCIFVGHNWKWTFPKVSKSLYLHMANIVMLETLGLVL